MTPRISALIPAFDAADTLAETLASVAAQSRPADETVVVDDGSADATAEIAARFAPRVRVLRQANAGPAAAFNAALAASTGEFVAPLDADDLWPADRLAVQAAWLDAHPEIDGVGGAMAWLAGPADETPRPCRLAGAMLIRRRCFAVAGSYAAELRSGHHIEWIARAEAAGLRFAVLDHVTLLRRTRPGSLSQRPDYRAGMLDMARRVLAAKRARDGTA